MIDLTEIEQRLTLVNSRKVEITEGTPVSTACLWKEYSVRQEIAQSIRIGLGRTTTKEDIDTALRGFATALEKLR